MSTDTAPTILITGASSDIGCALIRSLLGRANPPVVLAHAHNSGEKLRALQAEFGETLKLYEADFTQSASVSAMADRIVSDVGTPFAMVHLPALRPSPERFTKFNWERFETDLAVQVQSAVILLQRFLPKMAKTPGARVVFILSSYVHGTAPKYMSMYTTVKYAQLGLMRSLASEYAATHVRINAISPSMVETQFLADLPALAIETQAASNPQQRNATPGDLLGAIELLLSPASDYIQGIAIPITAGTHV
ncbi:MAG TPA: SDR family oxidoreductase [Acidobacteriaceae bacterium]|jgi:3-oxoacyl-[acyl-carrier protein] reductase|nr:SDR family oxidoreductase [Acidobacteriaceae bacterium]